MAAGASAQQNLTFDANGAGAGTGGSGSWNTVAPTWSAGGGFQAWNNAHLDNAVFAGSAGTVTLGVPIDAHDLTFNVGGYLLTGSTLTLGGTAPTLTMNVAVTTINAALAGSAGLVKNGVGTLVLAGNNTALTGVTTVNAGTLRVNGANSLGLSTAADNLVLNAGSTLFFNTGLAHDYTLTGGGVTVEGAAVVWSGAPVLSAATTLLLGSTISGSTLSGVLADTGTHLLSLVRNGGASMKLSGANTYSGATTVERGDLQLDSAGAMSSRSNLVFAGAAGSGGTLGITSASGNFTRGLGTGAGQVQWAGDGGFQSTGSGRTVNLGGAGASLAWGRDGFVPDGNRLVLGTASNNLLDFQNGIDLSGGSRAIEARGGMVTGHARISGVLSGGGGLHLVGSGMLELSATNTYNGGTRLDAGTLVWSADANLGNLSGAVEFNGGTLLNTSAFATARRMTLDTLGGVIDTRMDLGVSGWIDGVGALVKHGPASLVLGGFNTYTGATSVVAGTLVVDGVLGPGPVAVSSGATLTGAGNIGGPVSVTSGGTLRGQAGQTLTTGALLLSSGSTLQVALGIPGGPSPFKVNGALTLDGQVEVSDLGNFGVGTYRLISYSGVFADKGLAIGSSPSGASLSIQTAVPGLINLVNTAGQTLDFWDGGDLAHMNNNMVDGGSGIWSATTLNWANQAGTINATMKPTPGFAIFQASPGVITVRNAQGAIAVTGMQFASDGYVLQGDAIQLVGPRSIIRVGDGSGVVYAATIHSALTGTAALEKTDAGTPTRRTPSM
ncbi:hypothetical protein BH11PSE13_BH11PSE13_30310 [soil metagenome]